MARNPLHALLLTLPLLVVAACGDDGAARPDAGPGGVDAGAPDAAGPGYETYCGGLAASICGGTEACGCPEASTEAECTARVRTQCEAQYAPLIGMAVLGYLEYAPAQAQACADAVRAVAESCASPTQRNRPAACLETFVDRAALGAACSAYGGGLLCAGGQGACVQDPDTGARTCAPLPAADAPCPVGRCAAGLACVRGACAALGAPGAPCGADDDCALGAVCGVGGTCAAPAGRGAPCGDDGDCAGGLACDQALCGDAAAVGAACETSSLSPCGAERYCAGAAGPNQVCRPRARLGEGCTSFDACEPGLACDFSSPVPACRALPGAGEPCVVGACAAGLTCDNTSTCVTPPGAGAACLVGASTPCAEGHGCDPSSNLCVAGGAVGAACVAGACVAGAVCDGGGPPRCRLPGGVGATCGSVDALCATGLHCDLASGLCASPVGTGGACMNDLACGPDAACDFGPSGGACAPLPSTEGADCKFACGGGLRCGAPPGRCAPGACSLRR